MPTYPLLTNPKRAREFLTHIHEAGQPEKVTTKYLESVGFKGKNDRGLIRLFKFIGFLDNDGRPHPIYATYRTTPNASAVLADAIRKGYSEVFKTYPDAQVQSDEKLIQLFKGKTGVSEGTARAMVKTFKSLCSAADFAGTEAEPAEAEAAAEQKPLRPRVSGTQVHIDLHIHIPDGATEEQIENLLAGIGRHLLGRE